MEREEMVVKAVLSLYSLDDLREWIEKHREKCNLCLVGTRCGDGKVLEQEYWLRKQQAAREDNGENTNSE